MHSAWRDRNVLSFMWFIKGGRKAMMMRNPVMMPPILLVVVSTIAASAADQSVKLTGDFDNAIASMQIGN